MEEGSKNSELQRRPWMSQKKKEMSIEFNFNPDYFEQYAHSHKGNGALFRIDSREYPSFVENTVSVPLGSAGMIQTTAGGNFMAVIPVSGVDLALWPGVLDGTIFDLNVRGGLGRNPVRESLDEAIAAEDADMFIAAHNGITVMCRDLVVGDECLRATGLSVVNGAQTLIALQENRERISINLRILVKFISTTDSAAAAKIAIGSNTQNTVKTRSLRALDRIQIRLRRELGPMGIDYRIRPGHGQCSNGLTVENDEVAQYLCAAVLLRPWNAVWRDRLFEDPVYKHVFYPEIDSRLIALLIAIDIHFMDRCHALDDSLLKSLKTLRITMQYLVGRILAEKVGAKWYIDHLGKIDARVISSAVQLAMLELAEWGGRVDVKIAFKNRDILTSMGSSVSEKARFVRFDEASEDE